jgi:hypothetical protein
MPKARRTSRPKRFALYWCTTADGEEDWFVVADSARSARRFHEGVEDYQTGEAHAERVVGLPAELQTPEGWRDGPEGKVYPYSGWPSDELLVACGGEIAPLPRTELHAMMDVVCKDVRFGERVFRAGDIVTVRGRAQGFKEARLSVFKGGASDKKPTRRK